MFGIVTDIPGSPLPSRRDPEKRGIVYGTIGRLQLPNSVAVSNSGEVVVSQCFGQCIGVYSNEGKHIRTFGLEGSKNENSEISYNVAITSDNHILIVDKCNERIQMFTIEGRFVKSVGQGWKSKVKFKCPTGIAVHPSGKVLVADTGNHCIQVLNPDLSYSHQIIDKDSKARQFHDVAINSIGVVYVTDTGNHCVLLFSVDGDFKSSFGIEGSEHGQLHCPHGICIDSANTVYITDYNHRVSVYTSSGEFIKCFGTRGSRKGELDHPEGVAVDNTTGALYVCDSINNRVVVY